MVNNTILKYAIKSKSIIFWCTAIDENNAVVGLFNDLLLDMSKEHKVFFHAYRLPDVLDIIDPAAIISRAEVLLDPFNTFFHLSDAKVKSDNFDHACEATIYYFKDTVEWTDFLATSPIKQPKKLIKEGILSAYFSVVDQGADCWLECSKKYEKILFELFDKMACNGYEIKRTGFLTFPYTD